MRPCPSKIHRDRMKAMYAEFKSRLVAKHIRPGWAELTMEFTIWSERIEGNIIVPAGFQFDWDSIPRIPLVHASLKGRAEKAACVHDWLYRTHKTSRWTADKIFYDLMVVEGVRWHRRLMIYNGVRVGGWLAWHRGGTNELKPSS